MSRLVRTLSGFENSRNKKNGLVLCCILLSSLLNAASFPNPLIPEGAGFLAFLSLIPLFYCIQRVKWHVSILWGLLYGATSSFLVNFWVQGFHPLGLIVVPGFFAGRYAFMFPLMVFAAKLFPKKGFILQAAVWVGIEFLAVQGFLAYGYGLLGYTQYRFLPLLQLSSFTGVFGISLLVVFPSVLAGWRLSRAVDGMKPSAGFKVASVSYVAVMIIAIIAGAISISSNDWKEDYSAALIQKNTEPFEDEIWWYEKNNEAIISQLSKIEPDKADIIILSETAMPLAVEHYLRYLGRPERVKLVRELVGAMKETGLPVLLGSPERVLSNSDSTGRKMYEYNSAVLYSEGRALAEQRYRKVKLVPFGESFPFKEQFPQFYGFLVDVGAHFWDSGDRFSVIRSGDVSFGVPICFEDTFGDLCRQFVRNGASFLVNITDDGFAQSRTSQMQHLALSVFRAAENQRSLVRSANTGMTAAVNPDGGIKAVLPAFERGILYASIDSTVENVTFYTKYGDAFAVALCLGAAAAFLGGLSYQVASKTGFL